MKVHKYFGNGFQEVIYQRALSIEMANSGIDFKREYEMPIYYYDHKVGSRRVDFLVEDLISVELKAVTEIEPQHFAQGINYLEAFNLEIGLLINFGKTSMEFKRLTNHKFRSIELGK